MSINSAGLCNAGVLRRIKVGGEMNDLFTCLPPPCLPCRQLMLAHISIKSFILFFTLLPFNFFLLFFFIYLFTCPPPPWLPYRQLMLAHISIKSFILFLPFYLLTFFLTFFFTFLLVFLLPGSPTASWCWHIYQLTPLYFFFTFSPFNFFYFFVFLPFYLSSSPLPPLPPADVGTYIN